MLTKIYIEINYLKFRFKKKRGKLKKLILLLKYKKNFKSCPMSDIPKLQ